MSACITSREVREKNCLETVYKAPSHHMRASAKANVMSHLAKWSQYPAMQSSTPRLENKVNVDIVTLQIVLDYDVATLTNDKFGEIIKEYTKMTPQL